MRIIYLSLVLFAGLFSCQKQVDFDSALGPIGTGTKCSSNSFMPLTEGNSWTYSDAGSLSSGSIQGGDTLISGKAFKRVKYNSSPDAYYRDENGSIFMCRSMSAAGMPSGYVMQNLLQPTLGAGSAWTDSSVVNGIKVTSTYEMKEKNVSYQVDSLRFTDVHHVKYKVYYDYAPLFSNELVQVTDIYFAKCVGIIKSSNIYYGFGQPMANSETKITGYSLR